LPVPPSASQTTPLDPEHAAFADEAERLGAVTEGLAQVRAAITAQARAVGRDPAAVTLIAVSKTQPVERLEAALAAGQRVFGENRVQEARLKWPGLRARHPDLTLHLIGPLQTNKVKEAVVLFDVIQTLDRERLAEALATEAVRHGRCPRCLVEVNTGEEAQKAGIAPAEAEGFVRRCREHYHLPVTGLMCIPPVDEEPALHFALLADLARRLDLPDISMGMSADFGVAVRMGATMVRVGSAIFGVRHRVAEPETKTKSG